MKKHLMISLLLILGLGVFGGLFAQTIITVGEGTAVNTTTGVPTPYGTFYKNFHEQYLILASELENAGGGAGNISSIAFNVQTLNTCSPMPNYTIKMKHTTQAALTTTFEVGEYTTVWSSAEFMPVEGWNTHTFTTPFNWNGSSNIIVDIVTTLIPGAYTQNAGVFYSTTTFNSSLRYQSDTVDAVTSLTGTTYLNRPNIRFNMPALVITNPPNPANLVSPANGATLVSLFTNLYWASGGGLPTGYKLSLGTNNPPTNLLNLQDLGLVTMYDPPADLLPATTYYWKVTPYNAIGNALNCPVWSFTTHGDPTITALPYSQNWDLVTPPALPFDWSSIYQATVTTGYVKTVITSPNTTPNCVAMYNPTDINTVAMLIAPPLATTIPANTVRVKFFGKGSTTYAVKVGVMTSPTDASTFTELQTITLTSAWVQYVVPLSSYTGSGRFIAFKHANNSAGQTIYIDGVDFELIAANDLAAVSVIGNTTPSVGNATNYTVNVFNNGTASQNAYTVKLYNALNVELGSAPGITVSAGVTVGVQIAWTPTTEGPAVIYGKVILTGDVNATNNQTPNLNITVMPAGVNSVTIGDGSQTARMPMDFYFKNSLYQTIYYTNEIGMFGNINSLSVYNNFFTATLTSTPVKIWMGTTQLNDLSAGWIPSTEMTLVFDGNLAFPAGENTITFPLQNSFTYSGGNLVIMWNRPMDTVYYSSSDYFKCQTVGTNRARNVYSDSTVYDPAAPGAVGTVTGQFPKTTLVMTPLSPDPIFSINPSTYNYGTVLMGTTANKSFSIMNAGGGTLNVSNISISGSPYFTLQNLPTLPANLNTGQTATFTVRYNPTAAGNHATTVSITDNRMVHTVAITGTSLDATIYTLPYTQNFDTVTVPAFPVDWSSIYQATVTTGYVKTVNTSPNSAPNCVAMYNPTDINTVAMLIAPPLNTTLPANTVRVKFYAKGSTTYAVKVGVMTNSTDASTFTEVQTITLSATWTQYTVPLTSYTGAGSFIAFKHANNAAGQTIYLDNVEFELIAANDLAALLVVGNVTPSVGAATPYTVNVFNNGTASQSTYTVKLYNGQNVELASVPGTTVAAGAQVAVALSWTPTTEGPTTLYGKVVLAGDVNATNDQSPNLNITVMPAGILTVTIGDGSQTARMPIDMFYRNSVYQTLYYPDEIGLFGNINAITLYNQFTSTTLMNMPTKIWIGSTTQMDLEAGWIPSTAMTLVFDSTVNYPVGENSIIIPLSTPFAYTGGNLVIMWNRPMDTQYYSSSDYFKCQTVGTNRARNIWSDSTIYDPSAMTGGTLTGQFPKTTLTLTPMGADPIFLISPASLNFGDITISGTATQTFTVRNVGGGTLVVNSITIAGSPVFTLANLPTLPVSLTVGQTCTFGVSFAPVAQTTYNAVVTVVDNLTGRREIGLGSATDRTRTTHTVNISGAGVSDITIGSGNTNARIPIDMYYHNSLFETIIYPAEMSNFIGMIMGIKLYNQFSTNLPAMPTKIWIGTTTQADLATDWIPSTQLTQVFNGTVDYPSGANTISINFPEPFLYLNGQNLVLLFNRPMDTQYYSSLDYFKCQTVGTNRARNIYNDSTEYDPAAPTGGTVTGQFPKITFVVTPGNVGTITGTILGAGSTPLAGVAVNVANRDYNAVTDAAGYFTINNVLPANYTVNLSKFGYLNHTQNIVIEEDETEIINVTMTPMATVSVNGSIVGSDTGTGLSGATITLTGYQNYNATTTATGTFTIPSVYANQAYSYTILSPGYTTANGNINVGATNHNMGTITLTEIAYAPYGVEAALNGAQTLVNIAWQAPDPTAVDITESFEGTAFPPATWSQVITNTGPANAAGIYPTWCTFGATTYNGNPAAPVEGVKQAGMWWDYNHQDEWLITPAFNCPPSAFLRFNTWCFLGSVYNDHYYVKISTDGGNLWSVLWDATAQTGGYTTSSLLISLDLTQYGGQQIKLAWHAEDPSTNDGLWYGWFVDNIIIGNPTTTLKFSNEHLTAKSASQTGRNSISNPGLSREAMQNGLRSEQVVEQPDHNRSVRSSTRTMTGYKVWRLRSGQEANQSTWTLLTPEVITTLTYSDTAWGTLPNGTYRWAVKAIYTAGVASVPSLSNIITWAQEYGNIVGVVRKPNTQPLAGAIVTAGSLNATTNSVGAYSLALPVGVYTVTCSATGYQTQTIENIQVLANQNTTQNFNMIVSAGEDEVTPVAATALIGNHPNPFNPETTISYAIKEACNVRLEIYNLRGQRVRSLMNGTQNSGNYRIVFDSRDDKGNALSSGIYLYRLSAGNYTSTRKMMLME